jgi:hypothetical protein
MINHINKSTQKVIKVLKSIYPIPTLKQKIEKGLYHIDFELEITTSDFLEKSSCNNLKPCLLKTNIL